VRWFVTLKGKDGSIMTLKDLVVTVRGTFKRAADAAERSEG
jgi:hypothetical protein